MSTFLKKTVVVLLSFFSISQPMFAQKEAETVKPFSGSKDFRKFSVGINAGVLKNSVAIGGTNDYSNNQLTVGFGINAKYQLTHSLAVQGDLLHGKLKGNQDTKVSNGTLPTARPVKSFKTNMNLASSASLLYTFGNINWLCLKNWMVPYLGAGAGLVNYSVKIVKLGSNTETKYLPNSISNLFIPVSMGVKFKVKKAINLDLGYKMHFVDADNFDGYSYYTVPGDQSSKLKKDKFSYTYVGIEYAFGKKNKEQLLFDNPAARANSILQSQIKKLEDKVDTVMAKQKGLDDSDGDGIADLFDKESNTPAGSAVDSHGAALDTDGDGVPDFKDKQLITPTECLPVNADGVGKCPDPECCKTKIDNTANCPTNYPSIGFKANLYSINNDAMGMISNIASKLKLYPDCKIMITGYPMASKSSQANCQKRLDAIKLKLTEKEGISADRISTNCEVGGGDTNTVDVSSN